AARRRINRGQAVIAFVGLLIAAELVGGFIEVYEAADEKVEASIVVVVEPYCARRPPGSGNARFFRDVSEGSVPIVVIEDASSVLGYVDIGEAVAIVVADGGAHSVAVSRNARLI